MPSTQRARSRLNATAPVEPPTTTREHKPVVAAQNIHRALVNARTSSPKIAIQAKKYLTHLPTLVIAVIGHWLLFLLLIRVRPSQVQNILIPNSYLPIVVLFFLSQFFLWSYIFLHRRRGLFAALLSTTVVFLRLQSYAWNGTLSLSLIVFVIIDIVVTQLEQRLEHGKKNPSSS